MFVPFLDAAVLNAEILNRKSKKRRFPGTGRRRAIATVSAQKIRLFRLLGWELGDRDLNPDHLIQSQAFCRLNYPPSVEYI